MSYKSVDKRSPGRPPGSKNKKTVDREEAIRRAMDECYSLVDDALRVLREKMLDSETRDDLRVKCAEDILDRACGKPKQATEIKMDADVGLKPMTAAERKDALKEILHELKVGGSD